MAKEPIVTQDHVCHTNVEEDKPHPFDMSVYSNEKFALMSNFPLLILCVICIQDRALQVFWDIKNLPSSFYRNLRMDS